MLIEFEKKIIHIATQYAIEIQNSYQIESSFCGGFTTFSTFAAQGNGLLISEKPLQALLYLGLSVVVGMALAFLGLKMSKI